VSLSHERVVHVAASTAGHRTATSPFSASRSPTMDEGDVVVQHEKLPSISLGRSASTDLEIQERLLKEVPEIERIVARVGRTSGPGPVECQRDRRLRSKPAMTGRAGQGLLWTDPRRHRSVSGVNSVHPADRMRVRN
jgi:hypothetical protein